MVTYKDIINYAAPSGSLKCPPPIWTSKKWSRTRLWGSRSVVTRRARARGVTFQSRNWFCSMHEASNPVTFPSPWPSFTQSTPPCSSIPTWPPQFADLPLRQIYFNPFPSKPSFLPRSLSSLQPGQDHLISSSFLGTSSHSVVRRSASSATKQQHGAWNHPIYHSEFDIQKQSTDAGMYSFSEKNHKNWIHSLQKRKGQSIDYTPP